MSKARGRALQFDPWLERVIRRVYGDRHPNTSRAAKRRSVGPAPPQRGARTDPGSLSVCGVERGVVHRLVDYPWVMVRLGCRYCQRRGAYRLARLSAKCGAEIALEDLLDKLARDCPWRRDPGERHPAKYEPKCGACFLDLDGLPAPSDLPPSAMGLRVVRGGRDSGPAAKSPARPGDRRGSVLNGPARNATRDEV